MVHTFTRTSITACSERKRRKFSNIRLFLLNCYLDLLESGNINRLHLILKALNLLSQVIRPNLVLHHTSHAQLENAVSQRLLLSRAPQQAVHLNSLDLDQQSVQIGLVVPRLDVEGDGGLGDDFSLLFFFGGFAGVVLGHAFGFELFGRFFGVFVLVVGAGEEVVVVIVIIIVVFYLSSSGFSWGSGFWREGSLLFEDF